MQLLPNQIQQIKRYVGFPLGFDQGSSYTALAYAKLEESGVLTVEVINNPSYIGYGVSSVETLLGEHASEDSEVTVFPGDERQMSFTVGRESFSNENTIGIERISRIRAAMFQHFAANLADFSGQEVSVTQSLPTNLYYQRSTKEGIRSRNQSLIEAAEEAIRAETRIVTTDSENPNEIKPAKIKHPEGFGANDGGKTQIFGVTTISEATAHVWNKILWDSGFDRDIVGKNVLMPKTDYLVLDIGGNTTDYSIFRLSRGDIQYDLDHTDAEDQHGLFLVRKHLRAMLAAACNENELLKNIQLSESQIEFVLEKGFTVIQGYKIDCTEFIKRAYDLTARDIYTFVHTRCPNSVGGVLCAGGGSMALKDYIEGKHPNVTPPWFNSIDFLDRPEVSTAIGCWKHSAFKALSIVRKYVNLPSMTLIDLYRVLQDT
jgi:hypothetical protein